MAGIATVVSSSACPTAVSYTHLDVYKRQGKNGGREDVKAHHYIISFDPKDAVENGLTMERAQSLGLQFCKENFPGHPAIVCTHPDGHNLSLIHI